MRELLISELKKGTAVESLFPLFNLKFGLSMQTAMPIRAYIQKNAESLSKAVGFNVANLGRRNPIDKSGFVPEFSQPMPWREGRSPENSVPFHLIEEWQCRSVVGEKNGTLFYCGESTEEDGVGSCCGKCAERMYILPKPKNSSQSEKGGEVKAATRKQRPRLSFPKNERGKFTSHLAYPSRG